MTSRFHPSMLFALVLVVVAGGVGDATAQQSPPTRTVLIQPTVSQQRFRQAVQQSQVRDRLRQNQLQNDLKQESLELARRPAGSTDPNDAQIDQARQAQDQLFQAQQRDRLQRYSDALMAQPVPQAVKAVKVDKPASKDGG